jgi:hypothetical protein
MHACTHTHTHVYSINRPTLLPTRSSCSLARRIAIDTNANGQLAHTTAGEAQAEAGGGGGGAQGGQGGGCVCMYVCVYVYVYVSHQNPPPPPPQQNKPPTIVKNRERGGAGAAHEAAGARVEEGLGGLQEAAPPHGGALRRGTSQICLCVCVVCVCLLRVCCLWCACRYVAVLTTLSIPPSHPSTHQSLTQPFLPSFHSSIHPSIPYPLMRPPHPCTPNRPPARQRRSARRWPRRRRCVCVSCD